MRLPAGNSEDGNRKTQDAGSNGDGLLTMLRCVHYCTGDNLYVPAYTKRVEETEGRAGPLRPSLIMPWCAHYNQISIQEMGESSVFLAGWRK